MMVRLEIVKNFIEASKAVHSDTELLYLIKDITVEIGFYYFALLNHVDPNKSQSEAFQIHNYPNSWANEFITNGLYFDDPVLRACLTRNVGFTWVEVLKMIEMTKKQRLILKCAAKEGLVDGFTVPSNIPGEHSGSCSFATQRTIEFCQLNVCCWLS